jgi:hypothetical protein
MAPFPFEQWLGPGAYIIYLIIGMAFGAVLEMSGFAKSTKLAAQFYFKDLTVLKVMFTAIITAMLLIFLASALKVLDYDLIWVNPTYLWPGIVGGLIMGVGFIIGGFCPGTSIVALATLKIDGFFFALGTLFGIFLFGETVQLFQDFWNSSFYGRVNLSEVFGLPTGVMVILVLFMAFFMFWGGEHLERLFGNKNLKKEPKIRYLGAGVMTIVGLVILVIGQPSIQDKWQMVANEKQPLLDNRQVHIHPGELLEIYYDDTRNLIILDIRDERDFNLFHLKDAIRTDPDDITPVPNRVAQAPQNTVIVTVSNDEKNAVEAWKALVAQKVPNVYILAGGMNAWLQLFAGDSKEFHHSSSGDETLRFDFTKALGSRHSAAEPSEDWLNKLDYTPKVKLVKKIRRQGGCG